MNPMAIVQTLMNQMKVKLPQKFQIAQNLIQSNGDPRGIVQQLFKSATPEQKQNLLNQMKQYNCPENILSQLQNMK